MKKRFRRIASAAALSVFMVFTNLAGYLPGQTSAVIAEETASGTSAAETAVSEENTAASASAQTVVTAQEASGAATTAEESSAAADASVTAAAETTAETTAVEAETAAETTAVEAETAAETTAAETTAEETATAETAAETTAAEDTETSAAVAEESGTSGGTAEGEETAEAESSEEKTAAAVEPFAVSVTPRNQTPSIQIQVQKVWENTPPELIPDEITVGLQYSLDGQEWDWYEEYSLEIDDYVTYSVTLSPENGWLAEFDVFAQTQPAGEPAQYLYYRVVETTDLGDDFNVSYSTSSLYAGDESAVDEGITVTNTYTKKSLTIEKYWSDAQNSDGLRPDEITFQLVTNLQDGGSYDELIQTVTMSSDDTEVTIDDLPIYDDDGNEIDYDLIENDVPYYESYIYESGYGDAFYVYNEEMLYIIVNKVWLDGGNTDSRPDTIDINLYQEGSGGVGVYAASIPDDYYLVDSETMYISYGDDEVVFGPLYRADFDRVYQYLIQEVSVDGYITDMTLDEDKSNGAELYYVITNTKTTSVQATKVWDDGDDTGNRPDTVTFTLRQMNSDGEYESTGQTQTLDVSAGETTVTFDDLPAYYSDDNEIVYDVVESMPEGYEYYASVRTGDAKNGFVFTNSLTEVTVSKVDESGSALAGAHLQILDADGNLVNELEWDTTTEAYTITGLSTGVTYTVHETEAPDGYVLADDIHFTIATDGTISTDDGTLSTDGTTLLVENEQTSVSVSKVDASDQSALAGAHLQILDADGNLVNELEWDTTTEAYTITGLSTGVTYTVHETEAPDGYVLADDIHFTIAADGTISTEDGTLSTDGTTLLVENEQTSVSVSKVDASDQSALAGAHLQILDAAGNLVNELEWDSTAEAYTITGLSTGVTYTVHETEAPDGYVLADDIHFTISTDGTISTDDGTLSTDGTTLLVENEQTSVSVLKADASDQSALAGAHLQILDSDGNVVTEWGSTEGAYTITGLSTGITYTLHETSAPDGYTVASDTHFTISADGTVTTEDGTQSSEGILLVEDSRVVETSTEEEITTEAETTAEEETTTEAETTTTAAETTTTAAETTTQTVQVLGIEDNSQIYGWMLMIGGAAVVIILAAAGIAVYRKKHED
jgi:hypothetical protein